MQFVVVKIFRSRCSFDHHSSFQYETFENKNISLENILFEIYEDILSLFLENTTKNNNLTY